MKSNGRKQKRGKAARNPAGYDYQSYAHRKWAKGIKDAAGWKCEACGRKPKKLHAHHTRGTNHTDGVALCPTCHDIVSLLSGHGYAAYSNPTKWRFIRKLVKLRREELELSRLRRANEARDGDAAHDL